MSWMDEAMKDLRPWIGRVRTVEDDVGLMAVRRAAGTFNVCLLYTSDAADE